MASHKLGEGSAEPLWSVLSWKKTGADRGPSLPRLQFGFWAGGCRGRGPRSRGHLWSGCRALGVSGAGDGAACGAGLECSGCWHVFRFPERNTWPCLCGVDTGELEPRDGQGRVASRVVGLTERHLVRNKVPAAAGTRA